MNTPREPNARPPIQGTTDRPRAPVAHPRAVHGSGEVPRMNTSTDSAMARPELNVGGPHDVRAGPMTTRFTRGAPEADAGESHEGGSERS